MTNFYEMKGKKSKIMATLKENFHPIPIAIARLRREEEEEPWISGEELNTDGSSDEGSTSSAHPPTTCQKSHKGHNAVGRRISAPANMQHQYSLPPMASEPVLKAELHLSEVTRRLSQMSVQNYTIWEDTLAVSGTSHRRRSEDIQSARDYLEEQEKVMLWRPKRGSLKLPHHDLQEAAASASQEQVG